MLPLMANKNDDQKDNDSRGGAFGPPKINQARHEVGCGFRACHVRAPMAGRIPAHARRRRLQGWSMMIGQVIVAFLSLTRKAHPLLPIYPHHHRLSINAKRNIIHKNNNFKSAAVPSRTFSPTSFLPSSSDSDSAVQNSGEDYFEVAPQPAKPKLLSGIPLFSPTDRAAVVLDDRGDIETEAASPLVWPIPLGHVPEDLRTCSIYQSDMAQLTPIQRCMTSHHEAGLCGFLYNETMGCLAAVTTTTTTTSSTNNDDDGQKVQEPQGVVPLLYRGECWFRVVEYEAKVPFAVATVELLEPPVVADDDGTEQHESALLVRPLLLKLKGLLLDYVQLQLETAQQPKTPLEVSMLQDLAAKKIVPHINQQAELLAAAQERQAVVEAAPLPYLIDLAPDLTAFTNDQRRTVMMMILHHPNDGGVAGAARRAGEIIHEKLSMERARQMAATITDAVDASTQDLKVGSPTLPLWARQIQKGTRVEYFWNIETGWCSGTVTGDPLFIVDEWILSVKFDDDGSTHRLALSADDKLRWRPLF
jgi:hypothetical protein